MIEDLIVADVHLKTCGITEAISQKIFEIRGLLCEQPLYDKYEVWCSNDLLHRFLIARHYKVDDSFELLMSAMRWRDTRIAPEGVIGLSGNADWESRMEKESLTGKVFVSKDLDKWGRPVVLLDNSVQNTYSVEDQQTFLAWNLDLACDVMHPDVDKYVVWINLEKFSIFNSPSLSSTTETMFMLCSCYPERLGHLIVYQPSFILHTVFAAVKYLIDAKTLSKFHFISGDVSQGSANSNLLDEVIGSNWREITGAETPSVGGCAKGYNHAEYWPANLQRIQELKLSTSSMSTTSEVSIHETVVNKSNSKSNNPSNALSSTRSDVSR